MIIISPTNSPSIFLDILMVIALTLLTIYTVQLGTLFVYFHWPQVHKSAILSLINNYLHFLSSLPFL